MWDAFVGNTFFLNFQRTTSGSAQPIPAALLQHLEQMPCQLPNRESHHLLHTCPHLQGVGQRYG